MVKKYIIIKSLPTLQYLVFAFGLALRPFNTHRSPSSNHPTLSEPTGISLIIPCGGSKLHIYSSHAFIYRRNVSSVSLHPFPRCKNRSKACQSRLLSGRHFICLAYTCQFQVAYNLFSMYRIIGKS